MALRNWTPARIGRLWLIGAVLESILILGPGFYARSQVRGFEMESFPPAPPPSDSSLRALEAQAESAGITTRRLPDSSLQILRHDRLMATIAAPGHGDSLNLLVLSPAARAEAETVATAVVGAIAAGIGQGLNEAMPRIYLILGLIYLPIPLGLVGVTLAWWFARRGSSA